jgi:signal transduction histidine kinase
VIARGVYPAVLRDQGPMAALEEVLADLPRGVRLTGETAERLSWEVESGIYYLAAAAMGHLAGHPAHTELHVHLAHRDGRLSVRVDDPELGAGAAAALQAELAGDIERLAALGGDVEVAEYAAGVTVVAWLPERLGPLVGAATPGAGP